MLREIKGTKRQPRCLAFKVTGTGAAVIDEGKYDATLTDNGVGDWTLTFAKPFGRTPVAVVATGTANIILQVHTISSTVLRVKAYQAADGVTATDAIFHALVLGSELPLQTD